MDPRMLAAFRDELLKIAGVMEDAAAEEQRMIKQHASNPTFRKAMTTTGNPRQAMDYYRHTSNPALVKAHAAANSSVRPGAFKGLIDTSKKLVGTVARAA